MLTLGDVNYRFWDGSLAGVPLKEVTFELAKKEFLHIIWSINGILHDSTNLVEEIFPPLLSWGGGTL